MIKNLTISSAGACRWIGRIIGALLLIVTASIAIGQGLPNVLTEPVKVQVGFVALMCIFIGIVAGWKWELSGGIVSLFGWCLIVLATINSPRALNGFVLVMALPGAFYVASGLLRRHQERRRSALS
jgi:hypothetical protein